MVMEAEVVRYPRLSYRIIVMRNESRVDDAKRLAEDMRISCRSFSTMAVKVAGIEAGRIVELFTSSPAGLAENTSDYVVSILSHMPISGTYKMSVRSPDKATVVVSRM
jgi:hypothetical protein